MPVVFTKPSWLSLWGEPASISENEGASGNRKFDKAKTSAGSSRHASRATLLSEEGKAVANGFRKCSCLPRLEGGGPPLGGGGIIALWAICRKAAVSPSQPAEVLALSNGRLPLAPSVLYTLDRSPQRESQENFCKPSATTRPLALKVRDAPNL